MLTASKRTRTRIVQSRQNSRVKELRAGFARPSRSDTGTVSIEGLHLLEEALRSSLAVRTVFVRSDSAHLLDRIALPPQAEILELPEEVFESAVLTESPQGIAALVEPPAFSLDTVLTPPSPLLVVAAALQDPGNLGTLVRSAEAFGAAALFTLPGTVSIWNAKALRASSGSAFRLPVLALSAGALFAALHEHTIPVFAAVSAGGASPASARLDGPAALLIGNEGNGLDDPLLALADHRITIPTPGVVESLNAAVAASILLYEAARQRAAHTP